MYLWYGTLDIINPSIVCNNLEFVKKQFSLFSEEYLAIYSSRHLQFEIYKYTLYRGKV